MYIRIAILALCAHTAMLAHVRDVSSLPKHLDAFLQESNKPVIVAFYKDSCGPCKRMKPQFEQLAKEDDSITYISVSTSRHRSIAQRYQITRVPRFLYFAPHSTQPVYSHGTTDMYAFKNNIKRYFS